MASVWEYTYPFHDECSVSVRVVIVRCGGQGTGGSAARAVTILRHRAETRPVAELGTDKPNQTKGTGRNNEMGRK